MRFGTICAAMTAAFLFFAGSACAQEMDAAVMRSWMNQFADALDMLTPLNDSTQTVDPARPGEYLIEYEFGTVTGNDAADAECGRYSGNRRSHTAGDGLPRNARRRITSRCTGRHTNSADGRESGCAERTGERHRLVLGVCGRRKRIRRGMDDV